MVKLFHLYKVVIVTGQMYIATRQIYIATRQIYIATGQIYIVTGQTYDLMSVQTAFSSFKIMQDAFAGSLVLRCALVWGMVVRGCARRDLC